MKKKSIILICILTLLSTLAYAFENKITASDPAQNDYFGHAVSIDGNYAIVGAYYKNSHQGAAYIYTRDGNSWKQQAKLTASDAANSDYFGWAVSISGDYAVVGAMYDDDTAGNSGSAYIFKRENESWIQKAKLTASDAGGSDIFGWAVSISGGYAIIGSREDDDKGSNAGAAYIFKLEGNAWKEKVKLFAGDPAANDCFGEAVSISGNYAIVGLWRKENSQGAAYIFKNENESWNKKAKLTASDAASSDYFGYAVSISGDNAIVGAYHKQSEQGAAYIFNNENESWKQKVKLTASDAANSDQFGYAVSIYGNYAIVGAYGDDDSGSNSGSAYIFKFENNKWIQKSKLVSSDGAASDNFGCAVSISGDNIIVGARYDDTSHSKSGSSYIYSLSAIPLDLVISGYVMDSSNKPFVGATLTLNNYNSIATSDKNGYFKLPVYCNWKGTLNISKDNYKFRPTNRTYNPVTQNMPNQYFFLDAFTISGIIKDPAQQPIAGTKIVFSDNSGGVEYVFTNSKGYYSRQMYSNWSGTVFPSGRGYKYIPMRRDYNNVTSNQIEQDYLGHMFTISGFCIDENDKPIQNVKLSLEPGGHIVYTDEDGYFEYDIDYQWAGKLTPEKVGFDFSPAEIAYSAIESNHFDNNFAGSERKYEISGTIKDQNDQPLSSVNLCFGSKDNCVVTNSLGQYNNHVSYLWNGQVTPQKTGYTFLPPKLVYTNVSKAFTSEDYTGTIHKYIISGIISENNKPLAGVSLTLSDNGGLVTTNDSGLFSIEKDHGWQGTITPDKTGYLFEPALISYAGTGINSDKPNSNFIAQKKQITISGVVTDNNSMPVNGAIVKFTDSGSTTSNSTGYYSFKVDYGWTGKAEVFKANHVSKPPSTPYNYVQTDQIDQNYSLFPASELSSILVDPDFKTVAHEEGTIIFTLYASPSSLSCQIQSEDSWLEIQKNNQTLTVSYNKNTQLLERTGLITVKATNASNSPQTITIIQDGAPPPITGPTWKQGFDNSQFQYNQTITAIVKDDNNNMLNNNNDILAAFAGDECRGFAHPIETTIGMRYFLQIWSNTQDEVIHFKHYDAQNDRINHNIMYPIEFKINNSLGTIIMPHVFKVSDYFIRTALNKGWNWISINVTHEDMSIDSVMASLKGNGIIIVGQEGYAQYMSTYKNWSGSLLKINPSKMYMLKLNNAAMLEFSGNTIDSLASPITLNTNWNWIGYLPDTNMAVNTALKSINNNALKICGQKGYADYLKNEGWFGSLETLEANHGYMLKMEIEDTLYYPDSIQSKALSKTKTLRKSTQKSSINGWIFDSSEFQHQGTITASALLKNEETGEAGDALVAFVNDNCRGIAKPTETPYGIRFFLQVWGSENEIINLKFYHASENKVYTINYTTEFSPNMSIGSITEPKQLIIDNTETEIPQDWTVISSQYQHQGTITAIATSNSIITGEQGDKLAAFVSDECRGVATPVQTPEGIRFFLQIWGQENEVITCKYYKHSENKIYDIDKTYEFKQSMTIGTIETPEEIPIPTNDDCSEIIAEKDKIIEDLNNDIATKNINISQLNKDISDMHSKISELNYTVVNLTGIIDDLKNQVIKCNTQLNDCQKESFNCKAELINYKSFSMNLSPGWHLISGLSGINGTVKPRTEPEGAIGIMYFYKDGAYKKAEELAARAGYWVYIKVECKFIVDVSNLKE